MLLKVGQLHRELSFQMTRQQKKADEGAACVEQQAVINSYNDASNDTTVTNFLKKIEK